MPSAPDRLCSCGKRVRYGYICACQVARRQAAEEKRQTSRQRGYSKKWDVEARAFLSLPVNRLCACGCGRTAQMVDHIIPHRGNPQLMWDRSNWQAMTTACHSRKTAKHDGGFGNPTREGGSRAFESHDGDRAPRAQKNSAEKIRPTGGNFSWR
ncbi:HNH endonuclease [Mesorhizobium sp. B2-3-5]|uniref:HNH endonuclease signature motif containing protein n=1 Tax=Mesorhizobium sp. B2-3-5 TaxID=2589958 RepID=UPI00112BA553|nr:HNH endonuclease [Mesorhizobium sp. B2-3-5]TPM36631.1 HNH endonuclease [Mesorhizobium sp. B2-3-5]